MDREQFEKIYRHSMAHILAKAVIEIYGKDVQYGIGPQISDGCYYDFVLPAPISETDFPIIEEKMKEIIRRREDWKCKKVSKDEALTIFKNQKFKTELIQDIPEDETITLYYTGDTFVDLCRGPHIDNSQLLMNVAFQIKSVSGAYWKGDEHRDQMQRIYLYVFTDKKMLKEHLKMIKEAMERDHKKLGPQLELFMFNETAQGMPYWLPRGWKLYQALLQYSREIQELHEYEEISAPVINNNKLWIISGHWAHYVNNMFIVPGKDSDEMLSIDAVETMAAKPMNCPNAMIEFKRKPRSYKELPIRYSEYDVLHRKEKTGQLNGLLRVQEFRQDDDHTFVTEEMIEAEIDDILSIADEIYKTFGVSYRAEFSTRPDNYMGDITLWDNAERVLKNILDKKYGKGNYEINEGDGAFYGPKIDLQIKDALGREWQCGTIQLDFQLPRNFGLKYISSDGSEKIPVVIHRAIFGSLERFIGIIIENYKGAFPFWMSPYQVAIVPIRPEHNDYARKISRKLVSMRIRVEADYTDSNMKQKIKKFKNYKDPYILVLGDKEVEDQTVSINVRGSNKLLNNIPLNTFLDICAQLNKTHAVNLIEEV